MYAFRALSLRKAFVALSFYEDNKNIITMINNNGLKAFTAFSFSYGILLLGNV